MITHAKVAKLNKYMSFMPFSLAVTQISAATDEGLNSFEVDVSGLDRDMILDLVNALYAMEYTPAFNEDDATISVEIDE